MSTIIYFSFCIAFNFLYSISKKLNPQIIVLSLLILLLIPPDAAYIFTGASYNAALGSSEGILRIHPITIFSFFLFVFLIVFRVYQITENMSRSIKLFIGWQVIFIIIITVETLIQRGMQGTIQILENYIGPLLFFVLIVSLIKNKDIINKWIKPLLYIGISLGIFAVFEYITHFNPYSSFYSNSGSSYSYYYDTGYRCFTTIGHPLNNGLFFLSLLPLVYIYKSKLKQLLVQFVLLIGIIVSGARVSSIIAVIFILIFHMKIDKSEKVKGYASRILIVLVFVVALFYIIFYTGVTDVLIFRMFNDSSSSQIRYVALNYFFENGQKFLWQFSGIGGSSDFQNDIVQGPSSLEIPWMIMLIEMGLVPLLIFIISIVFPFYSGKRSVKKMTEIKYLKWSLLLMLLAATTYSSFGVKSHILYLIYGCIAVIYISIRDGNQDMENQEMLNMNIS